MALSNEIDLTVEQLPQNPITLTPIDETDYNNLVGKPKVNGVTLEGNKTSAQLGLASAEQGAKADSAVQPADLSVYRTAEQQDVIDNSKQDTISDLTTIRSGAALGATAVQPGDLATVATSGAYSDLSGTPTIPTVDQTYSASSANAQSGVAVASAITTKADTDLSNVTKPYVTETYVNGTSWYRVYSDGWCEQGGSIAAATNGTVSLLKPFVDTTYKVLISTTSQNANFTNNPAVDTKAISSFTWGAYQGSNSYDWMACGYIS